MSVLRWFACLAIGIAGAALFQTCVVNTNVKEEPIDPGRVYITSANIDESITSLVWSNDNSKIYYTGPAGLNAVTLASIKVTNIVAGAPMTSLSQSPDGSTLFYLTAPGGAGIASLWSVPAAGGTPQMLADSILGYALSPDGQTIAAQNSFTGELFLLNKTSAVRTGVSQGEPLLFSPDQQELVYVPVGSTMPVIRTLNGGAERPVLASFDSVNYFISLRWGTGYLYGILRDTLEYTGEGIFARLQYVQISNGLATILKSFFGPNSFYLSDDGETVGFWETDCLKEDTTPNTACVTSQWSISMFYSGPATKKSYVLHKTGSLTRGDGAISHDGTKFAYVAEGTLYLLVL